MIYRWQLSAFFIALGLLTTSVAGAASANYRKLPSKDVMAVIQALLATPSAPLGADEQCQNGPNKSGRMTISEGLARQLIYAANEGKRVFVNVGCATRPKDPLPSGQEYCELSFQEDLKPETVGYGLIFVMDWRSGKVVPDTVDCYGYD